MQTLSVITSGEQSGITSAVRDLTHATIEPMPRRTRTVTETPVTRALDAAVAEYDEAERILKEKDAQLRAAIIEAAKVATEPRSEITLTWIAGRVGWTRETINRIATAGGVRQRKPREAASTED